MHWKFICRWIRCTVIHLHIWASTADVIWRWIMCVLDQICRWIRCALDNRYDMHYAGAGESGVHKIWYTGESGVHYICTMQVNQVCTRYDMQVNQVCKRYALCRWIRCAQDMICRWIRCAQDMIRRWMGARSPPSGDPGPEYASQPHTPL